MSKRNQMLKEALAVGYKVNRTGAVLSPSGHKVKLRKYKDYLVFSVELPMEGKGTLSVSRFVMLNKYGEKALPYQSRHKNGNALDNSWGNILYGTQSQNMRDCLPEVLLRKSRSAAKCQRKLTSAEVTQLRNDRAMGMTYKELCAKYSLAKSTIGYICTNRTYREEKGLPKY